MTETARDEILESERAWHKLVMKCLAGRRTVLASTAETEMKIPSIITVGFCKTVTVTGFCKISISFHALHNRIERPHLEAEHARSRTAEPHRDWYYYEPAPELTGKASNALHGTSWLPWQQTANTEELAVEGSEDSWREPGSTTMVQIIMFGGHVLAKPRKFKKVAGTNKGNKEGTTGPGGELQEFAWKLVVAFLADCPRALVPLYSCSTGLHAMVVDMQDEALPSTLDAATAHLVTHEVSGYAYSRLIDPSDEFGDVTERLEEKIKKYEEACKAQSFPCFASRGYGMGNSFQQDDCGFVKTVDPRLVRACAATLPDWPSLPSWVTEDSTNADKVFSPRPLGRETSPVQMHKDTDENGDEVCVFKVRYRGEKPEPIATRDEDSFILRGEMKIFAPEWWLHYLALRILEPRGYVMNGRIAWVGEYGNAGLIEVIDNRVDVFPLGEKDDQYYGFPRGRLRYASKHKLLPLWGPRVDVNKLDPKPGTRFDVATFGQYSMDPTEVVLPGLGKQETHQIDEEFQRQPFAEYMEETLPRLLRYPEYFSTIDNGSKLVAKVGPSWSMEFSLPKRRLKKKAKTGDASRSESAEDGAKDAGAKEATSQADDAKHAA